MFFEKHKNVESFFIKYEMFFVSLQANLFGPTGRAPTERTT